jgi:AmmeMemoRadiSam system protein A
MQQDFKHDIERAGRDVASGADLPRIARLAIEAWVTSGEPLETAEAPLPAAGVFVTLRDAAGKLRGCVGSLEPRRPDLLAETARSAVLAATRDPRFSPVTAAELCELTIEVSVLLPAQHIAGIDELDPARYGVVVRDGSGRQGLLLPDVPGIDSAARQVDVARRKAGIPSGSAITLSRFEVFKYREDLTERVD